MGSKINTRELVQNLAKEGYSVPQITAALQINRTYGYSLLKQRPPQKRTRKDESQIRQRIQELCGEFPTNGSRRIRVWLKKKHQQIVNHKRVYRIMKEMGLLVQTSCKLAKRKKNRGRIPVCHPNQHFQTDMIKIWFGSDGWGYLFAVIDAYDRELLKAVNQALNYRFPQGVKDQGLTIRSDNGCQMTSR